MRLGDTKFFNLFAPLADLPALRERLRAAFPCEAGCDPQDGADKPAYVVAPSLDTSAKRAALPRTRPRRASCPPPCCAACGVFRQRCVLRSPPTRAARLQVPLLAGGHCGAQLRGLQPRAAPPLRLQLTDR